MSHLTKLFIKTVPFYLSVYEFTKPFLVITDPEHIKSILVRDAHLFANRRELVPTDDFEKNMVFFQNGQNWKRARHILSQAMTPANIKHMYSLMKDCSNNVVKILEDKVSNGEVLDMDFFFNYTMDVQSASFFMTKINSFKDKSAYIDHLRKLFKPSLTNIAFMLTLPDFMSKLLDLCSFNRDSVTYLSGFVGKLINLRKNSQKTGRNDFLHSMLETSDNVNKHSDLDTKLFDEKEIMYQSIFFILVGQEAHTVIAYSLYRLAMDQQIQNTLYGEIRSSGEDDCTISQAELEKLVYLDAVMCETSRLYPSSSDLHRVCTEDYVLGDTGLVIEKGTPVHVPLTALHTDPDYFENPLEFEPSRFLPENRDNIKPYTYLPFGAGPRSCIGQRFADLESKLVVWQVIKRFHLIQIDETPVSIDLTPLNIFPINRLALKVGCHLR